MWLYKRCNICMELIMKSNNNSERIECANCNNDISAFIELEPYNFRVICPHCYQVLDIEFCVNVDYEGCFEEHEYWIAWNTEDGMVNNISSDIEYYIVNSKNDLGMTNKELIGKKVGLIKKLKSGLYLVLDIEEKKAFSIPKYNLDNIKDIKI